MTRDIVDVVKEDIIDKIDSTITVKAITLDGDPDLRFTVCDLKWIKEGQTVFDQDDNSYAVAFIDRETNEIRTLRPSPTAQLKKGSVLRIIKPKYYHGTRIVANIEIPMSVDNDIRLAVPFIWLVETIPGSTYPEDSSQDFDADIKLFFLDEVDPQATNSDQRQQGVKPMLALKEAFYEAVEGSYTITRRRNSPERTFSLLGRETEKGMVQAILDGYFGGVEIRPTLTFAKTARCKC
jgi:hypothetical protein